MSRDAMLKTTGFPRRATPLAASVLLALAAFGQTRTPESESASSATAGENKASGTIAGTITAKRTAKLPEMIVYLESLDPNSSFEIPPERPKISQKGAKFEPSLLIVSVGQTVEFPNDEDRPVQHNVFSKSSAEPFDLGLYKPGVSKTVTFDKPGVVRLHCSIHKKMDGVIYVCPTPFFARVGSDGRFTIADVPPGSYQLRTWQRKKRFLEQSVRVEVTPEETSVVNVELSRK